MFVFIVARTPVKMRNSLRNELWEICKHSLISQTSKNWKAIVIGDTEGDGLDPDFFITLEFDEYTKREKIQFALDHIKNTSDLNPEYLIRFDDDDIFSQTILTQLQALPTKYDCYFDEYHTYIDAVYLKLSHKKNVWIANTAIHKYEHAITFCGKSNTQLIIQDHSEFWHIFYKDKNVFVSHRNKPVYFRVLTPFSITSNKSQQENVVDWHQHLKYLNGYGPWVNLPIHFLFYSELKKISESYFVNSPILSKKHWFFNKLKYLKAYFK